MKGWWCFPGYLPGGCGSFQCPTNIVSKEGVSIKITKAPGRNRALKMVLLILLALALVSGGVLLAANWNNWFGKAPSGVNPWKPEIDKDAGEYIGKDPQDQGGAPMGIKIPGYSSITFPANETQMHAAFLNPEGNPCYFVFKLVLKDTGEVLYTSKMVPPGKSVNEITLTRPMEPGSYPAVIQISTFDMETGSSMNGANVSTVLNFVER